MNTQGQFNFEADGMDRGYIRWLTGRRMAVEELARRIKLPLGQAIGPGTAGRASQISLAIARK